MKVFMNWKRLQEELFNVPFKYSSTTSKVIDLFPQIQKQGYNSGQQEVQLKIRCNIGVGKKTIFM